MSSSEQSRRARLCRLWGEDETMRRRRRRRRSTKLTLGRKRPRADSALSESRASSVTPTATRNESVAECSPASSGLQETTEEPDGDEVRCPICSSDLSLLSLEQKSNHIATCLALEEQIICPVCGGGMSDMMPADRQQHLNLCLDRTLSEQAEEAVECPERQTEAIETDNDPILKHRWLCPICALCRTVENVTTRELGVRLRHLKTCGKENAVRPDALGAGDDEDVMTDPEVEECASAGEFGVRGDVAAPPWQRSVSECSAALGPQRSAMDVLMQNARRRAVSERSTSSGRQRSAMDVLMQNARQRAVMTRPQKTKPAKRGWRRGWRASRKRDWRRCPSSKRVPGTPMVVDAFTYADAQLSRHYLLTHFHSDHYGGLTAKFDAGIIYCTSVTAALVRTQLRVPEHRVRALPVGTRTTLTLGECVVDVTPIDANHCPGAAIWLLGVRSADGRGVVHHLHTGDCRYHSGMLRDVEQALRQSVAACRAAPRVRTLFLDTTYCDPNYDFPPQCVAIESAYRAVRDELAAKGDGRTLVIFGTYSIGKERLFLEVARRLPHPRTGAQRKLAVTKAKMRMMKCLDLPAADAQRLTLETCCTNFWVLPMGSLRFDKLEAILRENHARFAALIAVRPTGWTFSGSSASAPPAVRANRARTVKVCSVPYSEHSSFSELRAFVRDLAPEKIVPTVNAETRTKANALIERLREGAEST